MSTDGQNPNAADAPILRIRPEKPEDLDFLFEVYAGTRLEEMKASGWDGPAQEQFLRMQFRAMREGYASAFPDGQFSILIMGTDPIGRVVVDRSNNEIRLVDIALLPQYRRRGLGTAFLKCLMDEAAAARKPLRLQVLRGNPAGSLYRRLGFRFVDAEEPYERLEWREGF